MQKRYDQYLAEGFPGKVDGLREPRVRPYKNSGLNGFNTWTIAAPGSPDDSTDYSINVAGGLLPSGGVTITYAADASSTDAEVSAGLLAAIQASTLYDYFRVALSGVTITLEALEAGIAYTVTSPSNASTTADLTVAETVTASLAQLIPFGRFVVRKTNAPADAVDEARLPTTASNILLLGVTRSTYDEEATTIGAEVGGYAPNVAMDVVTHMAAADGIWVKCDAGDIVVGDTLYIDTQVAANRGGITKTSTSNLALPATCAALDGAKTDPDGGYVIKLSVNLAN